MIITEYDKRMISRHLDINAVLIFFEFLAKKEFLGKRRVFGKTQDWANTAAFIITRYRLMPFFLVSYTENLSLGQDLRTWKTLIDNITSLFSILSEERFQKTPWNK